MLPKLRPPSEPEEARVTTPKGALWSVVPGVADHSARHSLTRAGIRQL